MIPLFSPKRQNEALSAQIEERLLRVFHSGNYLMGPEVDSFENNLKRALGYRYAIGCANGTDALILSLRALDLPPKAEVITPAFSFVASATAIQWAGYKPVLCDVDPETGLINTEYVNQALTQNTKAVIAVDLYGRQVDIESLKSFCQEHQLFLIEDGAQSVGVKEKGADVFTTSFYPTKNLGAVGDAGGILTDDKSLAHRFRQLTQHGATQRDYFQSLGKTGRLDSLQAGVLDAKLPYLSKWTEKRRALAKNYHAQLQELENRGWIRLPPVPNNPDDHVWSLYTLRIPKHRSGVEETFRDRGIGYGIYYSKPLHRQKAVVDFGKGSYPHAERLAEEVLSIPIFPELSDREQNQVVSVLKKCLRMIFT